jgi:hypothetical protein
LLLLAGQGRRRRLVCWLVLVRLVRLLRAAAGAAAGPLQRRWLLLGLGL